MEKSRRGFTLTEMLVVISIIGLGAAMTFTVGAGFLRGSKISQAARITQAALLEARSRAIATRMRTSMVFYRYDNFAVITNRKWEPLGQPVIIPEPCYYYISTERKMGRDGKYYYDSISPGGANKIAPQHYIMTVTFVPTGAAIKNIIRTYSQQRPSSGAVFINIVDPTGRLSARGGYVAADDGQTLTLTGSKSAFPSKGYCVVGNELVSYNSVGSVGGKAELKNIQRGLFGSGRGGSLEGEYVYPAGWCGGVMVICATGQVVSALL